MLFTFPTYLTPQDSTSQILQMTQTLQRMEKFSDFTQERLLLTLSITHCPSPLNQTSKRHSNTICG